MLKIQHLPLLLLLRFSACSGHKYPELASTLEFTGKKVGNASGTSPDARKQLSKLAPGFQPRRRAFQPGISLSVSLSNPRKGGLCNALSTCKPPPHKKKTGTGVWTFQGILVQIISQVEQKCNFSAPFPHFKCTWRLVSLSLCRALP